MAVWISYGEENTQTAIIFLNNNNLKYGDEKSSGEEYQTIIIKYLYKIKFT